MTEPRMGLASSFGWVRYPAKDVPPLVECWEAPDGSFAFVPKGKSFCVVKMDGQKPFARIMTTKQDR